MAVSLSRNAPHFIMHSSVLSLHHCREGVMCICLGCKVYINCSSSAAAKMLYVKGKLNALVLALQTFVLTQ